MSTKKTLFYLLSIFMVPLSFQVLAKIDTSLGYNIQQGVLKEGWYNVAAPSINPILGIDFLKSQQNLRSSSIDSKLPVLATTEIQQLARGFQNDANKIFEFVRNDVDYVPLFGSLNSATDTLLAGRGTDMDQASLLIAILRESGFTANYKIANVTYASSDLASLMGVEDDLLTVLTALAFGGIPAAQVGATTDVTMIRVWVEATVNGQVFQLDPTMVAYQQIAGLDIDNIISYNKTTFTNQATAGATIAANGNTIQNLNRANIRNDLTTFSVELIEHIRTQIPNVRVADIVGGKEVVAQSFATLPTVIPFAIAIVNEITFADMNNAFRHTMRFEYEGIDITLFTDDLHALRLSFSSNVTNQLELRLGGTIIATGNVIVPNTKSVLQVSFDHPYPALGGTFADQSGSMLMNNGTVSVALFDFNNASLSRVEHFLQQAKRDDSPNPIAEDTLGADFQVATQLYTKQASLFNQLLAETTKVRQLTHHLFGIVNIGNQDPAIGGISLDLPFGLSTPYATATSVSNIDIDASNESLTLIRSGMESLFLEQSSGGIQAVSTIKLLDKAVKDGEKIFKADASNWIVGENIRNQLVDYDPTILGIIDDEILNNGAAQILPENGLQMLNQIEGFGSIVFNPGGGRQMLITTRFNGGFLTQLNQRLQGISEKNIAGNAGVFNTSNQVASANPGVTDPVDAATGVFEYNVTDINMGNAPHYGMKFQRLYNSKAGVSEVNQVMGKGWAHTHDISLLPYSDTSFYLGTRQAVEVADTVVILRILFEQMKTNNPENLQDWLIGTQIAQFQMDQAVLDGVTASFAGQTMIFAKLLNGEFASPPNVAVRLVQNGNDLLTASFNIHLTNGDVLDFAGVSKGVSSWRDSKGNQTNYTYQTAAQTKLTQVSNNFGDQINFNYTGDLLSSISDHSGRIVIYAYNAESELISSTDTAGEIWRYSYDNKHQMTAHFVPSDSVNPIISQVYDNLGRVITQTDKLGDTDTIFYTPFRVTEKNPDDSVQIHIFDKRGLWKGSEDSLGNNTNIEYDGLFRFKNTINREGSLTQRNYHPQSGYLTDFTDSENNSYQMSYTKRDNDAGFHGVFDLSQVNYPDGSSIQTQYDASGNLTQITDQAGNVSTITYNANGQVLELTNSAVGVVTQTFDANGNVTSRTSSDEDMRAFTYDNLHRLTKITRADNSSLNFAYDLRDQIVSINDFHYVHDQDNLLTSMTDAQGNISTFQYDDMQQLVSFTDREGKTSQFSYDALHRLTQVTDASNLTLAIQYDILGRTSQVSLGTSSSNSQYSAAGYLTQQTSQQGFATLFMRSSIGELNAMNDPLNRNTILGYDGLSRLTDVIDPLNRIKQIDYDPRGLVSQISGPVIGSSNYQYSNIGGIQTITDFNNQDWQLTQTLMGRKASVTDPLNQTTTHTYDNISRIDVSTYADGNTLDRAYDFNGSLVRKNYTDGTDIQFSYDSLNRLTAANDVNFAYDKEDRITTTFNGPNQTPFTATYDDSGRLLTVSYDGLMTVTYSYNIQTGLLQQIDDDLSNSTIGFVYDNDRRLVSVQRSNGVDTVNTIDNAGQTTRIQDGNFIDQQFTFDAAGQLTTLDINAPITTDNVIVTASNNLIYDNASQSSSAGNVFDPRGRQTLGNGRNYNWDDANRLTNIDGVSFTYNGMDQILTRTDNGFTTEYLYNHAIRNAPIMAQKISNTFNQFYIWTPDGKLIYSVKASDATPLFYHFDNTGNTLALSDDNGNVVQSYTYSPYGKVFGSQGVINQPFTYVGRHGVRQEGNSGNLYQMRLRYYDSFNARFLSREQLWPVIKQPQMLNPYQYALNDPIRLIDPSGLNPVAAADVLSLSDVINEINDEISDLSSSRLQPERLRLLVELSNFLSRNNNTKAVLKNSDGLQFIVVRNGKLFIKKQALDNLLNNPQFRLGNQVFSDVIVNNGGAQNQGVQAVQPANLNNVINTAVQNGQGLAAAIQTGLQNLANINNLDPGKKSKITVLGQPSAISQLNSNDQFFSTTNVKDSNFNAIENPNDELANNEAFTDGFESGDTTAWTK